MTDIRRRTLLASALIPVGLLAVMLYILAYLPKRTRGPIQIGPGLADRRFDHDLLRLHLDCASCHKTTDPHVQVFGNDCATCHGTATWSIADYQHPLPSSTVCGECHLAPLSHYKEHFRMMSQPIAGVRNAEPEQCYLCHQTTSWNDIRGVGIYDHH